MSLKGAVEPEFFSPEDLLAMAGGGQQPGGGGAVAKGGSASSRDGEAGPAGESWPTWLFSFSV